MIRSVTRRIVARVGGGSLLARFAMAVGGLMSALIVFMVVVVMLLFLALRGDGPRASAATPSCSFSAGTVDPPPQELVPIYRHAAEQYGLGERGWAVLAAINRAETSFGRNLEVSSAGAVGWMQFKPETWEIDDFGVDADGDGTKNPYDPDDAIHAAAKLLRAKGAPGDWSKALFAYNPDRTGAYERDVLDHASAYAGGCAAWVYPDAQTTGLPQAELVPGGCVGFSPAIAPRQISDTCVLAPEAAPEMVKGMIAAANLIANTRYIWGGGHPPSDTIQEGYDCSGYTMFVLRAVGLTGDQNLVAENFMSWGEPGPGSWVTIWANERHVWMVIAGKRLDSGGTGRPGSAWRRDLTSTQGFVPRHPPGL